MAIDPALLFIAAEGPADGRFDVPGRIAIGGAVELEDVGVGTFKGEAAEAGLDTEPGESWSTAVVIDSVRNGAAAALPGFRPGFGPAVMIAAMPVAS